jgi:hypothetical protein
VYYLKIQDFDIQKHKRLLVQFMIVQAYIHCKENGNETARMTGYMKSRPLDCCHILEAER